MHRPLHESITPRNRPEESTWTGQHLSEARTSCTKKQVKVYSIDTSEDAVNRSIEAYGYEEAEGMSCQVLVCRYRPLCNLCTIP